MCACVDVGGAGGTDLTTPRPPDLKKKHTGKAPRIRVPKKVDTTEGAVHDGDFPAAFEREKIRVGGEGGDE